MLISRSQSVVVYSIQELYSDWGPKQWVYNCLIEMDPSLTYK